MVPAKATTNKTLWPPSDPLVSAERRGKSKKSKGKA